MEQLNNIQCQFNIYQRTACVTDKCVMFPFTCYENGLIRIVC